MAKSKAVSKPLMEFGATGLRQFSGYVREEFLRSLQGWRGLREYREMRDNDPVIGAMFFATERMLMGVDFTVEPSSNKPEDIEAADFINSCLGDTEQSWPELLSEILTFLQYGYAVHEICYKKRNGRTGNPITNSKYDDGMYGWRKFAGRAQESLLHWVFDETGNPTHMVQLLPTGGPLLEVPLGKCLHFKTRLLKNNPEGVSLLRNIYTTYYRKKRIEDFEGIGVERDLTGLPVAWVPARIMMSEASDEDKAQLQLVKKMVRDTVRNEQEGFVLPLSYDEEGNQEYKFELLNSGGKRQFNTTEIVDRFDHRMLASWLADFVILGTGGSSGRGSFAQSKNKSDMYALAAESFLDLITNEFNTKGIPDLLALNQMTGSCQMRHGDISEGDMTDFGQTVNQLASVGMITPDDRTEAAVRDKVGLPPKPGAALNDDLNTGVDSGDQNDVDDDPEDDEDDEVPAGAREAQGATYDQTNSYLPGSGSQSSRAARKRARKPVKKRRRKLKKKK